MGRLWKKINEDILTENDLMSLAKCHNVSVYRKESFKKYDTITFRCSQYRRFTKCQYQVKAKVFHDGIYQIFCSCKGGGRIGRRIGPLWFFMSKYLELYIS